MRLRSSGRGQSRDPEGVTRVVLAGRKAALLYGSRLRRKAGVPTCDKLSLGTVCLVGVCFIFCGGEFDVPAMGKRRNRGRSQLLSTMTKKQKKHLRDFGEEHPFYDRSGGARGPPGGLVPAGASRAGSVQAADPAAEERSAPGPAETAGRACCLSSQPRREISA